MSVSKWAYSPEKCDGDYCCGDCDNCSKAEDDPIEIRYYGKLVISTYKDLAKRKHV